MGASMDVSMSVSVGLQHLFGWLQEKLDVVIIHAENTPTMNPTMTPPPTLPVELNLFKTRFGARHACFKMMVVCAIYWNRDVAVSSLSHLVGLKSHNRHPFSSVPGHDICRQVDRRQASPEDLSLRFVVWPLYRG